MKTLLFRESPLLYMFIIIVWLILIYNNSNYHWIIILLLFLVALFYRDYNIDKVYNNNVLTSPADGKILNIIKDHNNTRISIFLNLHNVHVQKSPINGYVIKQHYKEGSFEPANMFNKSNANERLTTYILSDYGIIKVIQIAGMLVRRIVTWKKPGNYLKQFDNIGMIKFGSRVDIVINSKYIDEICVKVGDRVHFETILVKLTNKSASL